MKTYIRQSGKNDENGDFKKCTSGFKEKLRDGPELKFCEGEPRFP